MIRFLLRLVARLAFASRYHVTVKGLEEIAADRATLFLPNHVSALDPVLLFLLLDKRFKLKPLVVSSMFELPLVGWLLKKTGAIPIPDFEMGGNEYTRLLGEKALKKIIDEVKGGSNILFYPAGKLKRGEKEDLDAASGAFSLVQALDLKKSQVVLVRTLGLWGSSFSRAVMPNSVEIPKRLLNALKRIVGNLFFFSPKRKVQITFQRHETFPLEDKLVFNRFLENWYNATPDSLQRVPAYFWAPKQLDPLVSERKEKKFEKELSQEEQAQFLEEVARIAKRSSVTMDQDLGRDLGLDSLEMIELLLALSDHFETHHVDLQAVVTVRDLMLQLANPPKAVREKASFQWPENRLAPEYPSFNHLLDAFVAQSQRDPSRLIAGDDSGKDWSYKEILRVVAIFANRLSKIKEERIGVLLPATTVSTIVILACWKAKKIPVMVNWTLGSRFLKPLMERTEVNTIVTSKKFLMQAKTMDIAGIEDRLYFLEELKAELTLVEKLKGALCAARMKVTKRDPQEVAVILFTSGTESFPKSVPLTHANLTANQRAALSVISIGSTDVMLGFLPPFHSFGFSITGLLPFMAGFRVAYSPDPTDGLKLIRAIERWKVSLICGAPTFLQSIFQRAENGELNGVRLFISGAEKAPQALFKAVAQLPSAVLLEGYGITECAPILTLNRPGKERKGVGQPLPGISLLIVDPESHQPLPKHTQGLILASGPNVFSGYLPPAPTVSCFTQIDGKQWYVTGDLGYLSEDDSLVLAGRLKRFVKMGAEMINLVAIEEALRECFAKESAQPILALCAHEVADERPRLYLFTTLDLSRQAVNQALQEAGFSRLIKIDTLKKVETIPLLGTGKVDYQTLQALICEP